MWNDDTNGYGQRIIDSHLPLRKGWALLDDILRKERAHIHGCCIAIQRHTQTSPLQPRFSF